MPVAVGVELNVAEAVVVGVADRSAAPRPALAGGGRAPAAVTAWQAERPEDPVRRDDDPLVRVERKLGDRDSHVLSRLDSGRNLHELRLLVRKRELVVQPPVGLVEGGKADLKPFVGASGSHAGPADSD